MSESTGTWSHADISGHPADVYEPPQPADHGGVVLHLHGHSGVTLKDKPAYTGELSRHGLRAVCPHGGQSWWLDEVWPDFDATITPVQFVRRHVLPYIAERWEVEPPAVALTGISVGGQGALQLAYRFPRQFPVVAAVSPAVEFHLWYGQGLPVDHLFSGLEQARQQIATLQLIPLNWPRHQLLVCDPNDQDVFEGVDRLVNKLHSTGIPCETDLTTSAGGHSWDYFNAMASRVMAFVAERLEQESRRISH